MKATLELPADLMMEMKRRALHDGKKLEDAIADLLRKGLSAPTRGSATLVKPDKAMLRRRKELTRKFISGECGVDLAGIEQAAKVDRRKEKRRAKAWRN